MKQALPLCTALLIGACDAIPADPDGTLERVRAARRFEVGVIASPAAPERTRDLLGRLSRATGALPAVEHGAAEALLTRLEEGGLDLVVGEFAERSPWAARVTLSEPIAVNGPAVLAAATKNGENAWTALVHREVRAASR